MTENEIREIVRKTLASVKPSKDEMNLALAEKICESVMLSAKKMGVNAVVCVSDGAGNPRLVKSMDDAYIASYDVAVNKAFTVVALKMSTKALKPLAQPNGSLYGIQFTNNGRIVIFGGGEPLTVNGRVIGGLGVSGGSEEQDTELARLGREFFDTM